MYIGPDRGYKLNFKPEQMGLEHIVVLSIKSKRAWLGSSYVRITCSYTCTLISRTPTINLLPIVYINDALAQRSQHWLMAMALAVAGRSLHMVYILYICHTYGCRGLGVYSCVILMGAVECELFIIYYYLFKQVNFLMNIYGARSLLIFELSYFVLL